MDDTSGEFLTCLLASQAEQSASSLTTLCALFPRDAWNSLGKMSREEAMAAYIAEMKLVAQKVGEPKGPAS